LAGLAAVGSAVLIWRSAAAPPRFDEQRMLVPGDIPAALAVGPDDSIWFSIENSNALGVVRGGTMQRVPKGRESLEPLGLAVADDGSVWFTDPVGEAIGHLAADGSLESFPLPTRLSQFGRLAVAKDGSVWAADSWSNSLIRLHQGTFTAYTATTSGAAPFGVATDRHGGVWATLQAANKLIHIDPAGQVTELEPPTRSSGLSDVAVDASGAVWFVELRAAKIGRYADGRFDEYALPRAQGGITDLAVAPDGSVWFTMLRAQKLGRLRDGVVEEFALPRSDARPFGIRVDAAGNVWYTDLSGWLGVLPAADASRRGLELWRLLPWPRA
jgi:virginiamycin B lyase